MKKVRVNFNLISDMYEKVQEIARNEDTSSADIFRRAVKEFIFNYKTKAINEFYQQDRTQSNEEAVENGNTV